MDFKFVDISRVDVKSNPKFLDNKPLTFEKMKEYTKTLSQDFNFVRVDFYEINEKPYLSELTFFPAAGFCKYTNPNVDLYLGNMLKI